MFQFQAYHLQQLAQGRYGTEVIRRFYIEVLLIVRTVFDLIADVLQKGKLSLWQRLQFLARVFSELPSLYQRCARLWEMRQQVIDELKDLDKAEIYDLGQFALRAIKRVFDKEGENDG